MTTTPKYPLGRHRVFAVSDGSALREDGTGVRKVSGRRPGSWVHLIRERLPVAPEGLYDQEVYAAVRTWQRANGRPATGQIAKADWDLLFSGTATAPTEPGAGESRSDREPPSSGTGQE